MGNQEKTLLLELILRDLRGNWNNPRPRAKKALALAEELELPVYISSIKTYIGSSEEYGDWDGRYFRCSTKSGGYEGMEELHGLYSTKKDEDGNEEHYYTFADKSDEFKKEAEAILTYPESRFEDYERASLWPAH